MASVLDVAALILDRLGPMVTAKLHKLAYYSYGYHLAWEDRPLFPERFEAWANGPWCPALHVQHWGRFQLQPGDIDGDPRALDAGERESIRIVLDHLGHLTAHQLALMTHREPPWIKARERAGARDLDRSDEPLLNEEISDYFKAAAGFAP